ncbi:MAG: T9SS type A sorting domain-containing protein [Spartobacteria bacterium]
MRTPIRFCLTTLLALALCAPALAETDQEVAARQVALELAGAFANDGFKLRDGHWSGTLAPKEGKLIAVNLYAGNEYWFSAGATEKAKKLSVEVFDETGALVTTEKYNSGTKAAAGFSVINSGEYFIKVQVDEGEPAGVCFVYSYK